jgi:hypothetical protein
MNSVLPSRDIVVGIAGKLRPRVRGAHG